LNMLSPVMRHRLSDVVNELSQEQYLIATTARPFVEAGWFRKAAQIEDVERLSANPSRARQSVRLLHRQVRSCLYLRGRQIHGGVEHTDACGTHAIAGRSFRRR